MTYWFRLYNMKKIYLDKDENNIGSRLILEQTSLDPMD